MALIGASLLGCVSVWGWTGLLPLATGVFRVCPADLPFGPPLRTSLNALPV